ncbi:MAG: hypothetical protein R3190_14750, partial [Thermoanaerobaculia bacterium]|nr:hypothetical protein [Thermoanaerobaculia bacterium]
MGLGIAIAVGGAPDAELATAARVEVEERLGQATTFTLHYPVDIADGDLPRLADARLDQGAELSILVPAEAGTECLVKGPVHGQRVRLEH